MKFEIDTHCYVVCSESSVVQTKNDAKEVIHYS